MPKTVGSVTVYRSWFLGDFARGNHAAAPVLGRERLADGGRGAVAVALDQPVGRQNLIRPVLTAVSGGAIWWDEMTNGL